MKLDTMWKVMALWGLLAALAASAQIVERDLFAIPGISTNASNDSCANVDCQKGTCVPNNSSVITDLLFPYKCVCNSGWSTLESLIPLLAIPSLPCNIPNCTLNLNCSGGSPAPAPAPAPSSVIANASNSSACLVPGICGNGKCEVVQNGTLVSSFKCVCDPGYANILNMTAGYCANQCEIGGNCQNLGITLGGQSPSSPSPTGGVSSNSTSSSPNTGMPSSSPKPLAIPVSSPRITPVSSLGAPSPSFSSGWRHTPLSHGFYTSAGLMMLASFFLAQQ